MFMIPNSRTVLPIANTREKVAYRTFISLSHTHTLSPSHTHFTWFRLYPRHVGVQGAPLMLVFSLSLKHTHSLSPSNTHCTWFRLYPRHLGVQGSPAPLLQVETPASNSWDNIRGCHVNSLREILIFYIFLFLVCIYGFPFRSW